MANLQELEQEELIKQLIELLEIGAYEAVRALDEKLHYADRAEIMEELSEELRQTYFELLDFEEASEVLEEVGSELFSELIEGMDEEKRSKVIDNMSQDDIVDKLSGLTEEKQEELLSYMDEDTASEVETLLEYEEDSAGGRMTKDYVTLTTEMTIDIAIEYLRQNAPGAETIYYVFVTDEAGILTGVISLRQLIVASPETKISEIMNENVISVYDDEDQEEVARLFSKYDFMVMPVVDKEEKLKGIITVDDILDVIEEEATEDIYKFAGSSDLEIYEEDDASWLRVVRSVRSRLPWLIITIFGGLLSGSVVARYQGTLDANAALAMFMPLLAGMGGNVGTQSSTITVRSIAVGYVEGKEAVRTFFLEVATGFAVGLVCSVIVGLAAMLTNSSTVISLIVGIAMFSNIVTAAAIGTLVPMIFKKLGVDPAVASAPFISTTVDITGLTIYFSLATVLIGKWMI
ncbi:magnesium transporter [Acidaminobacter hydrogenoformans]|uniref:Magnesium transporter MgtE n=1 Tax=Acidaminobacter hydrogenoformans DSM 2784 TaxID=1120920 RepID=A0A1G5RST8_9FIRM|nr:magnesium transporter [Acidaminobacter hydrogenoformans]SCZ77152.1 magnesium transporter [Acidaminobacter hydrogenoformans DSM 2784]